MVNGQPMRYGVVVLSWVASRQITGMDRFGTNKSVQLSIIDLQIDLYNILTQFQNDGSQ